MVKNKMHITKNILRRPARPLYIGQALGGGGHMWAAAPSSLLSMTPLSLKSL